MSRFARFSWRAVLVADAIATLTLAAAAHGALNTSVNWTNQVPAPMFAPRGTNGRVLALALYTDPYSGHQLVVVGGLFSQAGTVAASNIAAWDPQTSQWLQLWSGFDGPVAALAVVGNDLYAGGEFTHAVYGGSQTLVSNLARWDGLSWHPIVHGGVAGVNGSVTCLLYSSSENEMYVGGSFDHAGDTPVRCVAGWQIGSSSWNTVGDGVTLVSDPQIPPTVRSMALFRGSLVVGGTFNQAGGGVQAVCVASWDGASWTPVGSGLANGTGVYALLTYTGDGQPELVAGGNFATEAFRNLAKFVGSEGGDWEPVINSGDPDNTVYALAPYDECGSPAMIIGGVFANIGGFAAGGIALYTLNNFVSTVGPMEGGPHSTYADPRPVYAVVSRSLDDPCPSAEAYVGGQFGRVGNGVDADDVAKWDVANSWSSLEEAVYPPPTCNPPNHCKVGGPPRPRSSAGGAMTTYQQLLIVGGAFTEVGPLLAPHVAGWNGKVWVPLARGLNGNVETLSLYQGNLVAGGSFTAADTVPVDHIAEWNGSRWSNLPGLGGPVHALAVYNNQLIAGGSFGSLGGLASLGSHGGWVRFNSGTNGPVYALALKDTSLYVGGKFTAAGPTLAHNVARWNGSSWVAMSSGTDDSVLTLARNGTTIVAGGAFTHAGGGSAPFIATWNGASWSALAGGLAPSRPVRSLCPYNGRLIAGVQGYADDTTFVDGVRQWTGSTWDSLGTGLVNLRDNGGAGPVTVSAVAPYQGGFYCLGDFSVAGGVPAEGMAAWGDNVYPLDAPEPAGSTALELASGWPNPFSNELNLRFNLPQGGHVDLAVFDIQGRRRATLVAGSVAAGSHVAQWSGRDVDGREVGPGVYFARLRVGTAVRTRTIVHIR